MCVWQWCPGRKVNTIAIHGSGIWRSCEKRNYWIKKEGAERVIVPEITRFGEKNKARLGGFTRGIIAGRSAAAITARKKLPTSEIRHATGNARPTFAAWKRPRPGRNLNSY
jgi:hypothetical protein